MEKIGEEDMILIDHLTEETVLENLELRFKNNLIYTNIGDILFAVNPYQLLPDMYTLEKVHLYSQAEKTSLPPHVFNVSQRAFYNLLNLGANQSIIISGESGSGKTETTKLIISYLASVKGLQTKIENMLVEANPILESFGNAVTMRNINSSRFGKYIEIYFDENKGSVVGAKVIQYLLEKSRVSFVTENERNYHVFYQLCAGADEEERELYNISNAEDFRYLKMSNRIEVNLIDDGEDFDNLKHALHILDFYEQLQQEIFKILSSILHLGNIEFVKKTGVDHSQISNPDVTRIVAQLLGLKEADLNDSLTTRTMEIKNQKLTINLNKDQAIEVRDTLAKAAYGRLFQWIVQKINETLAVKTSKKKIGILDIFGFENFQKNSFEQFCINYCNEKLQQLFINHIFKLEQEEYRKEFITWEDVDFIDNEKCLQLIESKPLGLLSIIDEECRFPKATDVTLLEKMKKNHEKHSYFVSSKVSSAFFGIKHYARNVEYDIDGFLEKNQHSLPQNLIDLYLSSSNSLVKLLFMESEEMEISSNMGTLRKKKLVTVCSQFKNQLDELMLTLDSTSPNFIRCVKPNHFLKANDWNSELVLEQLSYLGILKTIEIRKKGFAIRFPFRNFYQRYFFIRPNFPLGSSDSNFEKLSDQLLAALNMPKNQFQKGLTKIFLKISQYSKLEAERIKEFRTRVIRIQSIARGYVARKHYQKIRKSTIKAQSYVRTWLARKEYLRMYDAIVVLQNFARMIKQRKKYLQTRLALILRPNIIAFLIRKQYSEVLRQIRQLELERLRRIELERRLEEEQKKRKRIEEEEELKRKQLEAELKEKEMRKLQEERKLWELEEQRKIDQLKIQQDLAEKQAEEIVRSKDEEILLRKKKEIENLNNLEEDKERTYQREDLDDGNEASTSSSSVKFERPPLSSSPPPYEGVFHATHIRKRSGTLDAPVQIKRKPPSKIITEIVSPPTSKTAIDANEQTSPIQKAASVGSVREKKLHRYESIKGMRRARAASVSRSSTVIISGTISQNFKLTSASSKTNATSRKKAKSKSSSPSSPVASLELQNPIFQRFPTKLDQSITYSPTSLPNSVPQLQIVTKDPNTRFLDIESKRRSSKARLSENLSDFAFAKYCKSNYFEYSSGNLKKKKTTILELMNFSKTKLKYPLLKSSVGEDSKLSLDVWQDILVYLGLVEGKQSGSHRGEAEENILELGIKHPSLRNEIYCQVCKQLTGNPNEIWLQRAWELMAAICTCFPPDHSLYSFLCSFLLVHARNAQNPFSNTAQECLVMLEGIVENGPKHLVPNIRDLVAIKNHRKLSTLVRLMDGFELTLEISPITTCSELFQTVVKTIQLKSHQGFTIFETSGELERSLLGGEYIGDITSKWEHYKQVVMLGKGMNIDFCFVFKRQLFIPPFNFEEDPVEYELTFYQCAAAVAKGAWHVESKEQALELAALFSLYDIDNIHLLPNEIITAQIEAYIPRNYLFLYQPKEWCTLLRQEHEKHRNLTKDQVLKKYLSIVQTFPDFGCTIFSVMHKSNWKLPTSFDISVGYQGIKFLQAQTHQVLRSFDYDQIRDCTFTESSFSIQFDYGDFGLSSTISSSSGQEERELVAETIQGIEISHLIHMYIKQLSKLAKYAVGVVDSVSPIISTGSQINLLEFKKGELIKIEWKRNNQWFLGSNSKGQRGVFHIDSVRILVSDPTLKKNVTLPSSISVSNNNSTGISSEVSSPSSQSLISNVASAYSTASSQESDPIDAKLTLKKIKAEEKERGVLIDTSKFHLQNFYESSNFFRKKYKASDATIIPFVERFAYQKKPLQYSLIEVESEELNREACEIFTSILKYGGESPSVKSDLLLVQEIIQVGIEKRELRDEIYSQLLKQTRHDNKQQTLKIWELMAYVCACFPPSRTLRHFVELYLEENSRVSAENDIGHFASVALALLSKTLSKPTPRSQEPSLAEIDSIKYNHPLKWNIYLADRSVQSVEIESSNTVEEVVLVLGKQLGLKDNSTYGLYEASPLDWDEMSPIAGDVYFCDLLRKLEKSKELESQFIFRKRCYFRLGNALEMGELDLLYAESLNYVLDGKFSLVEDLATTLTGLSLQIKYGDLKPNQDIINEKNLKDFVPKDLYEALNLNSGKVKSWVETIKICWMSFSGNNRTELITTYLRYLQSVPFFGSIIFSAEQRKKPKKVLITLNKEGVFILNQQTKEIVEKFFWNQISSCTVEEGKSWHLTGGDLLKPIKLKFFTKQPSVINSSFEYIRKYLDAIEKGEISPSPNLGNVAVSSDRSLSISNPSSTFSMSSSFTYFNFEEVVSKIKAKTSQFEEVQFTRQIKRADSFESESLSNFLEPQTLQLVAAFMNEGGRSIQSQVKLYYEKKFYKDMVDVLNEAKLIEVQLLSSNDKERIKEGARDCANAFKVVKKILIRDSASPEDTAELLQGLANFDLRVLTLFNILKSVIHFDKGTLCWIVIEILRKDIQSCKSFVLVDPKEQIIHYKLISKSKEFLELNSKIPKRKKKT